MDFALTELLPCKETKGICLFNEITDLGSYFWKNIIYGIVVLALEKYISVKFSIIPRKE